MCEREDKGKKTRKKVRGQYCPQTEKKPSGLSTTGGRLFQVEVIN
jgi:hypothetical protein